MFDEVIQYTNTNMIENMEIQWKVSFHIKVKQKYLDMSLRKNLLKLYEGSYKILLKGMKEYVSKQIYTWRTN